MSPKGNILTNSMATKQSGPPDNSLQVSTRQLNGDGRKISHSLKSVPGSVVLASPAETVLRLVERELGPLGRVQPLADQADRSPFADAGGPLARSPAGGKRAGSGDRQPPVLRLAARAFGGSLRRVGDRLYLDGVETDLPAVVAQARARGVPIRYPGIDPMAAALSGGPSIGPPRRKSGPLLVDLRP